MHTKSYTVTGMSCEHCERAIAKEVGAIPGVEDVRANASDGVMTVRSSHPVQDEEIRAAIEEAGYGLIGQTGP